MIRPRDRAFPRAVATACLAVALPVLAACSVTVEGDANPSATAAVAPTAAPSSAASVAPSAAPTTAATVAPATATRTAVSAGPATPAATATRAAGTPGAATATRASGSPVAPIPTVPPAAGASPTAAPSTYGGVIRGDAICFPDRTDYCIAGRFRQHWEQNGGLPLNGYPLSDEFTQTLEDGKPYTVQYFERVRLEYHPEFPAPNDVLLGQFGRRILAEVPNAPTAAVPPAAGARHFPETGHTLRGSFLEYWQATGGLAQHGYPLSEVFTQRLEDGREYQVQYFERARFEVHPEIRGANNVLLGQFGRRILAEVRR
jgi:hypothetical protein